VGPVLPLAAAGWTVVIAAAVATVLTTASPRYDRDGEGYWLPLALGAIWLGGLALLILVARLTKKRPR
jgi:hypothetical protein